MSAEMANAPVLVTGGAGFIAFHSISRLLGVGRPVFAIDNFDPFYPRPIKERNLEDLRAISARTGTPFTFLEMDVADLGDAKSLARIGAVGSVLHLGAKAGVRPSLVAPHDYVRANVTGTLAVLEMCRARGVRDVVFASSSSVYGDSTPAPFREDALATKPVSPYAASKRAAELYCEAYAHLYGLRIVCARFFTVYGPRQRPDLAIHHFTKRMLAGEAITLFGDGTTERDYTFVADIVDGVLAAEEWLRAQAPGTCELVNLGGAHPTKLSELVILLEEALGMKARIERGPAQPGDVVRTSADVAKAQRLFGFAPKVSMREGLAAFAAWMKSGAPTT